MKFLLSKIELIAWVLIGLFLIKMGTSVSMVIGAMAICMGIILDRIESIKEDGKDNEPPDNSY